MKSRTFPIFLLQKKNALNARQKKHITGLCRQEHLTNQKPSFSNAGNASILGETTAKMDISQCIKNSRLKIIVRPNSPESEIKSYDSEKNALKVNIKAAPESGKANLEVVKFFSKLLKKKVEIMTGFKSKEKTLKIV